MFKKIIVGLFVMMCCFFVVPTFESKASASGEYYVPYAEPTANSTAGYFNVDCGNGGGTLYTYFWNITGTWVDTGNIPAIEMYVRISGNDVIFHPYVYHGSGTSYLTLGYYDSNGGISIIYYGGIGMNNYERVENFWGGIRGFSFGGNCSFGTSGLSMGTPLVHWNNSTDALALNSKLNEILSELSKVEGDTSSMVSQLQSIYNQNVAINDKLNAMNTLLNEIKTEQKTTNTWLEKIFDYLQESQEQQKQEAQTQGNNSTSQGMNAIEDKGAGFSSSLGGLTNSMSYTGTQCAWEFPEVKLPGIPGVMDEMVLIKKQPIDFAVWVNAIPSDILLVVQSLCTVGLIIYCFKELYSTIAYVLTLRKDDNS